jgi:hypothetical protein
LRAARPMDALRGDRACRLRLLAAWFFHYQPGDMGQMINFMKNITICGARLNVSARALTRIDDCVLRERIGNSHTRHPVRCVIAAQQDEEGRGADERQEDGR